MGIKLYNKLVRDKIPEIIKASGAKAELEILTEKEYIQKLKEKLYEELEEVEEATANEIGEEIADVFEVLYAYAEVYGIDNKKLEDIRLKKLEKRGGFKERLLLRSVDDEN